MTLRPRTTTYISTLLGATLCWPLLTAPAFATCPAGPPGCHPTNPRYLVDSQGNTLYLVGSHAWNNFQDWGSVNPPPTFSFEAYLDFLGERQHNFIRAWTWEHARWIPWDDDGGDDGSVFIAPGPFARTCDASHGMALDGGPKFDLSSFNEAYFTDIRQRIKAAGARDMVVGLMLFQGWSFRRPRLPGDPWRGHPFHHQNNCNGIDGDPPTIRSQDGRRKPTALQRTGNGLRTHSMLLPEVLAVQHEYVKRMINALNDLDNIIWEVANESTGNASNGNVKENSVPSAIAWQYHMIDFIKRYELTHKTKQHLVWMSGDSNLAKAYLDNSDADIISPGGTVYRTHPPVNNGPKISILDTDHTGPLDTTPQVPWKSFTRGHHAIYMDYKYGLVNKLAGWSLPTEVEQERIRRALGAVRGYADRMDLAATTPDPGACSTQYCLVNPGTEYLVYQDDPGQPFTVFLPPGTYSLEHFDTFSSRLQSTRKLTWIGGAKRLQLQGRPAVYLKRLDDPEP